jgi:hypothetical protein
MDSPDGTGGDRLPPSVTPASFESPEEPLQPVNDMPQANWLGRIGDVWRAGRADRYESHHKIRDGIATVAAVGVQGIGISRLPSVLVPKLTADILQQTHNAPTVGVAMAGIFGTWCATAGEAFNQGFSSYPTAAKKAEESFPFIGKIFSSSIPGMETPDGATEETRQQSLAGHIGKQALIHARRGVNTVAIGIAPYVGAAHMKGMSKASIRKLTVASGIDGGLMVGATSGAIAETIIKIGHEHPALAHTIQSDLGNTKLWWAVAGSLMVAEGLSKMLKRRQTPDESASEIEGHPQPNIPGMDFSEVAETDTAASVDITPII